MAKNSSDASGNAFVGCILVGLGLGFMFDHISAGIIIGTGIGFIVMAIMRSK